jgi:hypothetical protein
MYRLFPKKCTCKAPRNQVRKCNSLLRTWSPRALYRDFFGNTLTVKSRVNMWKPHIKMQTTFGVDATLQASYNLTSTEKDLYMITTDMRALCNLPLSIRINSYSKCSHLKSHFIQRATVIEHKAFSTSSWLPSVSQNECWDLLQINTGSFCLCPCRNPHLFWRPILSAYNQTYMYCYARLTSIVSIVL